ncbi:Fpg/Nei family DNA glycosylase [Streptomyces sp. NBC_01497]|uniref:Fpg/Nei family DNA glycosylase n=1 Tax=Streptomyces sp. NBC_01497 TaxID=2903885 RepID=UPI002E3047A3|nr:DNA-formamidopyrimidine glycosylase family protein [Streptomyces sp. NBC_01497]
MPELPDVEGFRTVLRECGSRRRVSEVRVLDAGVLRGVGEERLRRELEDRRLGDPWRHGKRLFVPVEGSDMTLVCHFGMTGSFRCCSLDEPVAAHDRVVLTLDDAQHLRYTDQRKLQGLQLTDKRGVERILDRLGPDALAVPREEFQDVLAGKRGAVKSALMDQSVIAGLGNLLSDEILWRARINPRLPARELSDTAVRHVHTSMGRVLDTSVRARCVPPRRRWLTGRREDVDPVCPRCGAHLRSGRVAGRRTVWCPVCQS